MDREKVIKALDCEEYNKCSECPYVIFGKCNVLLIRDVKKLLKDQEPVEPELEGGGSTWWHVCGECHGAIDNWDNYCKHCGRRIRHEKKAE